VSNDTKAYRTRKIGKDERWERRLRGKKARVGWRVEDGKGERRGVVFI
jgi:hypothetical protein